LLIAKQVFSATPRK